MPELPEVETIRQGLARKVVRKDIARVTIRKPKIVRGSARGLASKLQGRAFSAVRRHGKLLIFPVAKSNLSLLIHLKMTGQLIYQDTKRMIAGGHQWPPVDEADLPNKYTHAQITFADSSQLYFNDLRQFGFLELVTNNELQARLDRMGVDPLLTDLAWEDFRAMLTGRRTTIKAVLLNQQLVAGIGNIYADETLFLAKVRPQRIASRLRVKEQRAIWRAIPKVLKRALKYGGTTFRNFRDSDGGNGNFTRLLKVYGRAGQSCRRCKVGVIQKATVAQRGTHWCPNCQA